MCSVAAVRRDLVGVAAALVGRQADQLARSVESRAVEETLGGVVRRGDEVDVAALLVDVPDADDVVVAGVTSRTSLPSRDTT